MNNERYDENLGKEEYEIVSFLKEKGYYDNEVLDICGDLDLNSDLVSLSLHNYKVQQIWKKEKSLIGKLEKIFRFISFC